MMFTAAAQARWDRSGSSHNLVPRQSSGPFQCRSFRGAFTIQRGKTAIRGGAQHRHYSYGLESSSHTQRAHGGSSFAGAVSTTHLAPASRANHGRFPSPRPVDVRALDNHVDLKLTPGRLGRVANGQGNFSCRRQIGPSARRSCPGKRRCVLCVLDVAHLVVPSGR